MTASLLSVQQALSWHLVMRMAEIKFTDHYTAACGGQAKGSRPRIAARQKGAIEPITITACTCKASQGGQGLT